MAIAIMGQISDTNSNPLEEMEILDRMALIGPEEFPKDDMHFGMRKLCCIHSLLSVLLLVSRLGCRIAGRKFHFLSHGSHQNLMGPTPLQSAQKELSGGIFKFENRFLDEKIDTVESTPLKTRKSPKKWLSMG